jgi:PTS system ascorbate-specific IIA component
MPGILIIAHAPLASALRDCAAHVYAGTPNRLEAIDVPADIAAADFLPRAAAALARAAGDDGALLLVDAAGATPCNLAQRLVREALPPVGVRVVSGVNLPMLLRALCYQREPLDVLASRAREGGVRGIDSLSDEAAPGGTPC